MKFIKRDAYLLVYTYPVFDNRKIFCGVPFLSLHAIKHESNEWYRKYQIIVRLMDQDDFNLGKVYYPSNEEEFFDILHELINWMNDLEHGVCEYDKVCDNDFFPILDCKMEDW